MRIWIGGAGVAAVAMVLAIGSGGDTTFGAKRVGYIKSENRDRVMAYQANGPLTDAEARATLMGAPSTQGAVTMAVLYRVGDRAPGGTLTTAASLPAAARLIGEPPFDGSAWRLRVNPAGQMTFD